MNSLIRRLFVLATLGCSMALAADTDMVSLFDGKTLDGWEVRSGTATYRVESGEIVGTTVERSPNTFLCTKQQFSDFVLEFEVKCDPPLNSGVQFRSAAYAEDTAIEQTGRKAKFPAGRVYGYQVEIAANGNAGRVYDEARRANWVDTGKLPREESEDELARATAAGKQAYKPGEWNHYRVVAQGDHIQTFINGVQITDFRDEVSQSGFIGLQVHSIPPTEGPYSVRWRNIRIRELKPGETPAP